MSVFSQLPNRLIMDIVKLRTDADRVEAVRADCLAELMQIWEDCDYVEVEQGVEDRGNCDCDIWEMMEFKTADWVSYEDDAWWVEWRNRDGTLTVEWIDGDDNPPFYHPDGFGDEGLENAMDYVNYDDREDNCVIWFGKRSQIEGEVVEVDATRTQQPNGGFYWELNTE